MSRRSATDDAWAEAVWQRYQRRRELPFRRLEAAWAQLLDATALPVLRWLQRRPR
jgi:hypothetical protein